MAFLRLVFLALAGATACGGSGGGTTAGSGVAQAGQGTQEGAGSSTSMPMGGGGTATETTSTPMGEGGAPNAPGGAGSLGAGTTTGGTTSTGSQTPPTMAEGGGAAMAGGASSTGGGTTAAAGAPGPDPSSLDCSASTGGCDLLEEEDVYRCTCTDGSVHRVDADEAGSCNAAVVRACPLPLSLIGCTGANATRCTPQNDGSFQCQCTGSIQTMRVEAATCPEALDAACNTMAEPPPGDRSCSRETPAGEVSCSWHEFGTAPDAEGVYKFQCSCAYVCPMDAEDKSSTEVVSTDCATAMDGYCGVDGPLCPTAE